jgi:hypothetical protein
VPGIIGRVNALMAGEVDALLRAVYTEAGMPDRGAPVPEPRRGG